LLLLMVTEPPLMLRVLEELLLQNWEASMEYAWEAKVTLPVPELTVMPPAPMPKMPPEMVVSPVLLNWKPWMPVVTGAMTTCVEVFRGMMLKMATSVDPGGAPGLGPTAELVRDHEPGVLLSQGPVPFQNRLAALADGMVVRRRRSNDRNIFTRRCMGHLRFLKADEVGWRWERVAEINWWDYGLRVREVE